MVLVHFHGPFSLETDGEIVLSHDSTYSGGDSKVLCSAPLSGWLSVLESWHCGVSCGTKNHLQPDLTVWLIKHACQSATRPKLRRSSRSSGQRWVSCSDPPHCSPVVVSLARHFTLVASHQCVSIISVCFGGRSSSRLHRAAGATHVVDHRQCEWIMAPVWALQVPSALHYILNVSCSAQRVTLWYIAAIFEKQNKTLWSSLFLQNYNDTDLGTMLIQKHQIRPGVMFAHTAFVVTLFLF